MIDTFFAGVADHAESDPEVVAANSSLVFDAKKVMRDTAFTGEIL